MTERAQLHLVDGATGQAQPSAYTGYTLPELGEVLERKERELIGYRLRCGKLERELHDELADEPEALDVKQVLLYWRPRCMPKAKVVAGSERWNKVRARLREKDVETGESYSVVDLCEAVEGMLMSDYHRDRGFFDATSIFRDSATVDRHRATFRKSDCLPAPLMPVELRGQDMAFLLETCECGHRRLAHSKADPARLGAQACLTAGCGCEDFDDFQVLAEAWKRSQAA